MARSRAVTAAKSKPAARKSSTRSNSNSAAPASSEFKCSVCGRTFGRAAALGAHRRRAHGIPGTSARATRAATPARTTRARASASRDGHGTGADRDALLATLFPQGIPARENVIRSVDTWLKEADRLSGLR